MLPYPDASMGLAAVQPDQPTSTPQPHRRPHELDEVEASKTRRCCKKITKFLFSHIGLVGLVVIYAVAGAFLFELLEEHQERFNCQEAQGEQTSRVMKLKQNLVAYIQYNTTSSTTAANTFPDKDNTTVAFAKIGSMLQEYRDFVITVSSKYRYYGDNCAIINKWTFPNALLFAITIITTIGYGNITPVTWEGQLCSIGYATIGIPIFLLCVANISGVLGEMFRFIYGKIICRPCHMIKKHRAAARKAKLEEDIGESVDPVPTNGWTSESDANRKPSIKKPDNAMVTNPAIDEGENQARNERVAVPLTVTMIIIAAYIWIGSALFHSFEGWTMIQAGYFCFITLATIGFGDFVPGQSKDDPNAGAKLILGAIYVLFGMAILAMCFDLMQEEIVSKFRWIGKKIGIIEKDESVGEESIDPAEAASPNKPKSRSSTQSSMNHDSQAAMNTTRTTLDEDTDRLKQTRSISPRKSSPRSNVARVHPFDAQISGSDGRLHQRPTGNKAT